MKNRIRFCLLALLMTTYTVDALSASNLSDGVSIYGQAFQIDVNAQSKQDLEKALNKYEQSLKIFEENGSIEWQSKALTGMGWVIQFFGDNVRAQNLYYKRLKLAKKVGDETSISQALYALGMLNKDLANYPKGIDFLDQALVSVRKAGSTKAEGAIYSGLGSIYKETGDYPKAIEMFKMALDISRKSADEPGEVDRPPKSWQTLYGHGISG